MGVLRRSEPVSKKPVEFCGQDAEVAAVFPALVEFLTRTLWTATEPREPGTLLLCCQDGRWRLWINDRDGERSAWLTSDAIASLLDSAERGLMNDSLEWRSDHGRSKGLRKRS